MNNSEDKNLAESGTDNLVGITHGKHFFYNTSTTRSFLAYVPHEVVVGNIMMYSANSCNFGYVPSGVFAFASTVVATESFGQIITTDKLSLVPELYEPTREKWPEPIDVSIIDAGTNASVAAFSITLTETTNPHWPYLFAATVNNTTTIMPCVKGALDPNSTNKMGDLNSLAPIFIFTTANFQVNLCPNEDQDIRRSFKKVIRIENHKSVDIKELINITEDRRIDYLKGPIKKR